MGGVDSIGGVFGQLGIMVCVISVGLEFFIIRELNPRKFKPDNYSVITRPIMRQVYKIGPWVDKSAMHALGFSIIISLIMAEIFPAIGMAMFIGGMGSTVIMQIFYYKPREIKRNMQNKWNERKDAGKSAA